MTRNSTMSQIVKPILVLSVICLFISAALALTNNVTAPIIAETEKRIQEEARMEVLPAADGFELLNVSDLPKTITAAYRATNGAGYVFMITCDGYGGANSMSLICGIDSDGVISATKVLAHKETPGLGSRIAEDGFRSQFVGKDSELEGVEMISGATWSSRYYIGAVKDAFAALELSKEAA